VCKRLTDQYIQKWANDIDNSSKGQICKIFEQNFRFQKYLSILPNNFWKPFVKFRTPNHHLPIQVCKWYGIPLSKSDTGKLTDESYFILECKTISTLRKEFLAPRYCRASNVPKFIELMTSSNLKQFAYLFPKFFR
jgi:hypothetical protein